MPTVLKLCCKNYQSEIAGTVDKAGRREKSSKAALIICWNDKQDVGVQAEHVEKIQQGICVSIRSQSIYAATGFQGPGLLQ